MIPIEFDKLMDWIFSEYKTTGTVFGVRKPFIYENTDAIPELFGEKLEMPFGPAAGPNTQLAQNIIAAYFAGSRFFELKTVQKLDGEDLPVSKPCILAEDECYNVEWSTELTVPDAMNEYIKAWWACKLLSAEFGLGNADGFIFNMSVGYDLDGIKTPKIDNFIESLKDAGNTLQWKKCREYALSHLDSFSRITEADIDAVSPAVCRSITLSTLHGCPPQEIERIAVYLLTEKKLNTFIKCNPTLLGYEKAREILDSMGYDYIQFGDFHFRDDLQYEDAVPMLRRLLTIADKEGLSFGVKLTNTFPVDIKRNELPGEEMYMSGCSLYPLTLAVADKLSADFDGKLRISYSGGADYFNITKLYDLGIWPITFATTILKPGGYNRILQIAEEFAKKTPVPFTQVNLSGLKALCAEALKDPHHIKPIKPLPSRKLKKNVPLTGCFIAPCEKGCPINQDITTYMQLAKDGRMLDALKVIALKNPLPNITGTICAHNCMSKCTRNFYEEPVKIRSIKLAAAAVASEEFEDYLKAEAARTVKVGKSVAVIGAGPAGISAAFFLARAGIDVTVFDKRNCGGGTVKHVISRSRISSDAIEQDIRFAEALGVKFVYNHEVNSLDELRTQGFASVIVATGAGVPGVMKISGCETVNAIRFLEQCNLAPEQLNIGSNVAVIGAGNTAMDTARAAKALPGVKNVYLIYRRDRRNMPADEEELELALKDGVRFMELLTPFSYCDGKLFCKKNILGDYDASGRRNPVETDDIISIDADTVITAVGEKVDTALYRSLELETDSRGYLKTDKTNMTSDFGVYAAGDGLHGASTIVNAIRDAAVAADEIIRQCGINTDEIASIHEARELISSTLSEKSYDELTARKGRLMDAGNRHESDRCLGCNTVCENCADVCPNRANVIVRVPGYSQTQIIHVDYMCNECGNCLTFCPYAGAPYKDKFTLFGDLKSFCDSSNQGFVLLDAESGLFRVRIDGMVTDEEPLTEECSLPDELRDLINTCYKDYSYLF